MHPFLSVGMMLEVTSLPLSFIYLRWLRHFVSVQGTSVLAQTMQHISRKGQGRSQHEIDIEYTLAKCMKTIFNNPVCLATMTVNAYPSLTMPLVCRFRVAAPSSGCYTICIGAQQPVHPHS
jgi:hypothetical protein